MISILLRGLLISSFFYCGCSRLSTSLLPSDVRTINIALFQNKTFYLENNRRVFTKDLDVFLMKHLIRSFLKDGRLKVVNASDARWELSGDIIEYSLTPLQYSEKDFFRVKEFRAVMALSVQLIDKDTDKVLWSHEKFCCQGDFFVEGSQMTPERSVLFQMCEKMSRNLLLAVFEGWYR